MSSVLLVTCGASLYEWNYILVKNTTEKKNINYEIFFEPDSNQRPKNDFMYSTILRSTNWAIEEIASGGE